MNDFENQVIARIDAIQKQREEFTSKIDNLDATSKRAFEELTKSVKDSTADLEARVKSIHRAQAALGNELRMASGDPRQRIVASEEKRRSFAAMVVRQLGIADMARGYGFALRGLDEGNTPGSTYAPNAELETDIYDALLRYGAYRNLDVRTVSTKAVDIPVKTARVAAVFVDEAAAIGEDATKAGTKHTLTPKKIGALVQASTELLEDAGAAVVGDVLDDCLEAVSYRMDWAAFSADGTADSTDGGFTGCFHGGTGVNAASGNTTVETLDYEDVLRAITSVDAAVLQRDARWFIHPTMLARLLAIKDSSGRPIFNTAIEAPSYGSIGTILGFPVVVVGAAPSTNTAGNKVAVFGDPRNQAVRIRRDFAFERSDHFAFNTDEIAFRATARVATKTKVATAMTVLTLAAS